MYATWGCKNICSTLCITTITTQILPSTYNVFGSLQKQIITLDLVNITPHHTPETITKVSTTDRNRIHNIKNNINNITMGITSKCRKTADPRTNINPPMVLQL